MDQDHVAKSGELRDGWSYRVTRVQRDRSTSFTWQWSGPYSPEYAQRAGMTGGGRSTWDNIYYPTPDEAEQAALRALE